MRGQHGLMRGISTLLDLVCAALYRRKPLSAAAIGRGRGRESRTFSAARSRLMMIGGLPPAALAVTVMLAAASAGAEQSDMIKEPVAVLQGLDKITARVSEITAPVGTPVRFGTLQITVRDCEKNPPEDRPEDAAFLQIDEIRPGEPNTRRFSGWMFAQSPALSSLEHPVYDVILLDCKDPGRKASASPVPAPPSGNAAGNKAR
jgi:hypothetical protein